jgi:hypothetical protein
MGNASGSVEVSWADLSQRRLIYDRLLRKVASELPYGQHHRRWPPAVTPGVYSEFLDGVRVRPADGIHTPVHAPGSVFAGKLLPIPRAPQPTPC